MRADPLLETIASYVVEEKITSPLAYKTARLCFADAIGCAIAALQVPSCQKLIGPVIAGTIVPKGARVVGTSFVLDPIRAAFTFGTMVRWLDFNDTWLAAEWGHPSDNLGALLPLADWQCRNGKDVRMQQLFHWQIKAYEIQGVLALSNSFNSLGFDHVILVKIACAAVCTAMLGGSKEQVIDALSHALLDTGPLRAYRHAPCTGSRKSWAAGDAAARGLELAWRVMQGEMGYPQVLSAPLWGFEAVIGPLTLSRELSSYVIENILFKAAFPAEFHAQTAVEAAIRLQREIAGKEIAKVEIATHAAALRIIDKKGALHNPADRDHCLQYMIAIGLLYGDLQALHYEEEAAANPQIDQLRKKMEVKEDPRYSTEYLQEDKRSIANRITVTLENGQVLGPVEIEYPLGHRRRREESAPFLFAKLQNNLGNKELATLLLDQTGIEEWTVGELMEKFASG